MTTNGSAGRSALLPALSMIASAVFWGSMWYPMRQIAAAGMPGLWSGTLAYGLMIFPLLPLVFWRREFLWAGGWPLIATGASVAACNVLFAGSMVYGEIAMAILLFYLSPVWASILERLILKTPFTRSRCVAIVVALAGMAILQGVQGRWPLPANLSEWFGMLAGMCWAVGLVFARVGHDVSVIDKSIVQFAFALPIGFALILVMGEADLWPGFATLGIAMPWIVAATLFWVLPALVLSLWAAGHLSPGRASMLLMVEVIVGIGSAAWLAGETVGWSKIAGGVMIVSASIIDAWFHESDTESKATAA